MKLTVPTDLLRFCGVPERTIQTLKSNKVKPLHQPNSSAYYWGKTGTGKSTFAAAVLKEALLRSINVEYQLSHFDPDSRNYLPSPTPYFSRWFRFVNLPEFFFSLRARMGSKDSSTSEDVKTCKEAKLLVLDDLGAELMTDWAYSTLYLIINSRFDSELPTVFTSNFSLEELGARLSDERLISRVMRTCEQNIFLLEGWKE